MQNCAPEGIWAFKTRHAQRGLSATLDEWLMSAEYILSEGNQSLFHRARRAHVSDHARNARFDRRPLSRN